MDHKRELARISEWTDRTMFGEKPNKDAIFAAAMLELLNRMERIERLIEGKPVNQEMPRNNSIFGS